MVPAFDEARRLQMGTERLLRASEAGAFDPTHTEIIVVDDGSTDQTADRAQTLLGALPHLQVIRLPVNAGKGAAVRQGIAAARAPLVAFIDADMSIDPQQIPALVRALADADVAIGSRSLPGSSGEGVSWQRAVMGRAFNALVNAAAHLSLSDTQCGFKAFRTGAARLLFQCGVIDRYAFDVEVLYLARRFGMVVTEVPVHWRQIEGSRIRPLHDPAIMLKEALGRWSGRRAAQPVEAVVLSPSTNGTNLADTARAALGPAVPVVPRNDGATIVLLPLCAPAEVDALTGRLQSAIGAPLRRIRLTTTQVAELGPISMLSPAAPPPRQGRRQKFPRAQVAASDARRAGATRATPRS